MTKRTLLLTCCLLFLLRFVSAQEAKITEDAAIRQTVQFYYDGWKNHDVAVLRKAVHPKAKWLARTEKNHLIELPSATGIMTVRKHNSRPEPFNMNMRIVSVDVAGKAAIVKAEFVFPEGIIDVPPPGVCQTEYLSLIKFDYGWRIISKVYYFEKENATSSGQRVTRR
jgi:hypothetical protein